MSKVVSNVKPPSLRTDEDLVQLVLELHYRSLTYGTKQQHDAASAAVTELKRRLGQRDAALKLAKELRHQRAHTYASENADLYRGFDNGCRHAAARIEAIFAQKE